MPGADDGAARRAHARAQGAERGDALAGVAGHRRGELDQRRVGVGVREALGAARRGRPCAPARRRPRATAPATRASTRISSSSTPMAKSACSPKRASAAGRRRRSSASPREAGQERQPEAVEDEGDERSARRGGPRSCASRPRARRTARRARRRRRRWSRARASGRARARAPRSADGSDVRVASRPAIAGRLVCSDASRVSSMANRAKLSSTIAPATTETVRRRPSSTPDRVRAACRPASG